VVAQGTARLQLPAAKHLTADYLSGRRHIPCRPRAVKGSGKHLVLKGASAAHNLQNVELRLCPWASFICVTGVSGSGKSYADQRNALPHTEPPLLQQPHPCLTGK
jgi:excinuclease ABC subunit A